MRSPPNSRDDLQRIQCNHPHYWKKVKETPIIIIAAVDIDLHEGEAMSGDGVDSLVGTIVKTLRPVLEGNFEMI